MAGIASYRKNQNLKSQEPLAPGGGGSAVPMSVLKQEQLRIFVSRSYRPLESHQVTRHVSDLHYCHFKKLLLLFTFS